MTDRKAFTLIELLIVVAIIAVLAAIAVPNFLEARTRSMVARVYADHRSYATAIEAYRFDFNREPMTRLEYSLEGADISNIPTGIEFISLTTPVAYLTSIIDDPFGTTGIFNAGGVVPNPQRYDYSTTNRDGAPPRKAAALGYRYMLVSVGPSLSRVNPDNISQNVVITQILTGNRPLFIYDATNGTISDGYIMRTNKGIYQGEDYVPQN